MLRTARIAFTGSLNNRLRDLHGLLASEPWQRLYADYCGPPLRVNYALAVVDSIFKMAGSLYREACHS